VSKPKFRMLVVDDPLLKVVRGRAVSDHYSVRVAKSAEAERAPFIICMAWSDPPVVADNVRTVCMGCGRAVQHRPQAPKAPPKVCMACAPAWALATRH
jgi:hypothetical protein